MNGDLLVKALVDWEPDWYQDAACRQSGIPRAVWHGEDRDPARVFDAKCVCWHCPVLAECQRAADAHRTVDLAGIWGGESDEDRRGRRGRPRKQPDEANVA